MDSGVTISSAALEMNWALQVPPSAFPHTQAIVGVLCVPGVVIVALPFAGLFASPLLVLASVAERLPRSLKEIPLRATQSKEKGSDFVAIIRFAGVLVLFPMLFVAFPIVGPYSDWVASTARWYAYSFEAEQFCHCRMLPGERIAYISDEYVIR